MSIHLGNSTIGLTYNGISSENLNALKKAVYNSTGVTANNIPAMVNALTPYESDVEAALPEPTEWVRPAAWPDLDSLNLPESGDDYIYMTYNLNINPGAISLNFSGSNIVVTVGHIDNGTYVVDETVPSTSTTCYYWLDDYSGYVVVRVTGSITYCYNVAIPAANKPADGRGQSYYEAPFVERYAYLPHATKFIGTASASRWGSAYLEHEKLSNNSGNTTLTNLNYTYSYCTNLKKVELDHLYTQNVTTSTYVFQSCYHLQQFIAPAWDLKKCTTFAQMFGGCMQMAYCDLSAIETSSSKITSIAYMFNNCYQLKRIDGLNALKIDATTTGLSFTFNNCKNLRDLTPIFNWTPTPTSLDGIFYRNSHIKFIDLSKWHLSNVTQCESTFYQCFALERIIFPTFGANVTSCTSMFYQATNLRKINIENFTLTSACTSFNSMFFNCYNLVYLNLSHWNVSGGISFADMFNTCFNLKVLNLSTWEISDACTALNGMFNTCRNLERLIVDFSEWDTSNVTTLNSMFYSCNSLHQVIDLSDWDVKKVTTVVSMFRYSSNIPTIILDNWKLDSVTTVATWFDSCEGLETISTTGVTINSELTTAGTFMGSGYSLKNYGGLPIPLGHTFANLYSITHESLLNMLNALPEVSKAQTLKIGTLGLERLTDTEKAIATNKGWTLAS